MTHPTVHARTHPNKIAYQMAGTGKAITQEATILDQE